MPYAARSARSIPAACSTLACSSMPDFASVTRPRVEAALESGETLEGSARPPCRAPFEGGSLVLGIDRTGGAGLGRRHDPAEDRERRQAQAEPDAGNRGLRKAGR